METQDPKPESPLTPATRPSRKRWWLAGALALALGLAAVGLYCHQFCPMKMRGASHEQIAVPQTWVDGQLKVLTSVLQSARAVPHQVDGKMKGFLITQMNDDSPFRRFGLLPEDVIVAVQDVPLDNPGRGLMAFQKLRDAQKITVHVERAGKLHAIEITLTK